MNPPLSKSAPDVARPCGASFNWYIDMNPIDTTTDSPPELLDACKEVLAMLLSPKFKEWKEKNRRSDTEWAMVAAMDMRETELMAALRGKLKARIDELETHHD